MQHFYEKLKRRAATSDRLVGVQVNVNQLRLTIAQGPHRGLCYLRIDFRPGEAAARTAIGMCQHLGSDTAWSRANGLDDCSNCNPLAMLESILNFVING